VSTQKEFVMAVDQKQRAIEIHHEHADLFQQRYEQLQQNP